VILLLPFLFSFPRTGISAEPPSETFSPGSAESVTNEPIRQIEPGIWQVGGVRLDKARKTIAFPAIVNLREGMIEYVVVADHGKIHESILRTEVQPYHVHLALVLLGAKGGGTNDLPVDPGSSLPGDRLAIEVSWKVGRRFRRSPAGDLVLDRKSKRTLRKAEWVFTGSRFREDGFAAQADGSIISLITDPDALVNNGKPGREDDDNWLAAARRLPERDSVVEVKLTLLDSK
jgi:hypothetical protein